MQRRPGRLRRLRRRLVCADEPDLLELPRLVFPFNRRDHGRLRVLINYLNDL